MKRKKIIFLSELEAEFKHLRESQGLHPLIDRDDFRTIFITKEFIKIQMKHYERFFDTSPHIKEVGDSLLKLFDKFQIDFIIRDVSSAGGGLILASD